MRGTRPGDRYVRVVRREDMPAQKLGERRYQARVRPPRSPVGRSLAAVRRVMIGRPLTTEQGVHQRLSKTKALAVFSSDALSSVAYATQEILIILLLAGTVALGNVIPISIGIALLLGIVIMSYRQTVMAYPGGGGAYIVAKHNLGTYPSLVAAAALLIDYVLTVAVSVSAGVAAITSALPDLRAWRVEIGIAAIVVILVLNLRGVAESGTIFSIPTYAFVGCMVVLISLGIAEVLGVGFGTHAVERVEPESAAQGLTLFLILRAFAAGCTALTGVEAISDGVPAFKEPAARNAATTLAMMGLILGAMFLGISFLASHFDLIPNEDETIISQLARTLAGGSIFYYVVQGFTALILILAANTAFADFPRLASFLARDKFLPHQFLFRGDRLAFTTGIIVLGLFSGMLIVIFDANVTNLIPLYAVGVFTSFTLSQGGMTKRWLRSARSHARSMGLLLNGGGAIATTIVLAIIVTTKFLAGAWIVIAMIPLIVLGLRGIHGHYRDVAEQLRLTPAEARLRLRPRRHDVVAMVPIESLNIASTRALEYAMSITSDVTAVHIASDAEDAAELQDDWRALGIAVPLVIIESPYRSLVGPLVDYVETMQMERGSQIINVVLPEFVPAHLGEHLLHNQSALRLKAALLFMPNVVVTDVPYHLED